MKIEENILQKLEKQLKEEKENSYQSQKNKNNITKIIMCYGEVGFCVICRLDYYLYAFSCPIFGQSYVHYWHNNWVDKSITDNGGYNISCEYYVIDKGLECSELEDYQKQQ